MVRSIGSFSSSGLREWVVQRVTGLILTGYVLFLCGFFLAHPDLQFADWNGLFAQFWFRMFSLLAILSVASHCWIGLWGISTDYIHPAWLRLLFQILVILALVVCTAWAIEILWGV